MADASQTRALLNRYALDVSAIAADDLERELWRRANVRTGRMRRETSTSPPRWVGPTTVRVTTTSTAPYARFVDEGTKPHTIRARRAKALRFRAGGRTVFRRSVRHPGYRGSRWWTNSLDGWRRNLPYAAQRFRQ